MTFGKVGKDKEEEYKKSIGKLTIADYLDAQKLQLNLAPKKTENNILFLAWIANRLIKAKDPYWDKTEDEMIRLMNVDTVTELNALVLASVPDQIKKKSLLMQ